MNVKPAWTRRTRIQNLNQNVLFHLPRWTVEEVEAQRERAIEMARRFEELVG